MADTVERKRRIRLDRILDAAARIFARDGFHAARMDDIAAELDLTKAALYYYCDSKEDLFVKVIEERVGIAVEALESIDSTGASATTKVREAILVHLRIFHHHPDIYTMFLGERLRSISADAASVVDEMGRRFERRWADFLSEGIQNGEFRQDLDVPITVKATLSMCNMTLTWFQPDGRLGIEELAARFGDLVIGGIEA
ncbi:MAG TPA: TetR/AcrR family transcriptional regulator [Acidimicrobiia bacterium]|nr:TetR/AcrR family transcriptional regulator [Acidimicrobiia bacterium]